MRTPRTLLAPLVLLAAMHGQAQTPRFEAGAQLGANVGWLRGNMGLDDTDPSWGPAAGLTLQYEFSKLLGLRVGLGYQQKGMRLDVLLTDINGNPIASGNVRHELDYLMLPVMARATFGTRTRFSVGAGPYAGYLVRAQQTWTGEGFEGGTFDTTDDLERWDMGISVSVGAGRSLGDQLWLNAEVRYDKGLTNISALPVVDDGSIRTNAVCLLVGCSYRFGSTL